MRLQTILTLSFLVLTAGELQRKIKPKGGKACVHGKVHDVLIKLGPENQRVGKCKEKCLLDDKCVAMQFKPPKRCSLWYTPIDSMESAEGAYCGSVNLVDVEPIKYTDAPTTSPTYEKDFVVEPYTKCAGDINWNRAKLLEQYTHVSQCQRRCKKMQKCKSYQWNGRQNTCILIKYKVQSEAVPQTGPTRVCGSIAITTDAPTRSPVIAASSTKAPTKAPVKAPTKAPVKSPVALPDVVANTKAPSVSLGGVSASTKAPAMYVNDDAGSSDVCTLRAKLVFPFGDDINDADFYGYHADYFQVENTADPETVCGGAYKDELPEWCTYENSNPDKDTAYFASLDDAFAADETVDTETIHIFNASGGTFTFAVSHLFFDEDYYSEYQGWEDHVLAAVLKIKNMTSKTQNQLNPEGWSHPTDIKTPTHILDGGKWKVNPDYQDKFVVTVTCDDGCQCDASYHLA